MTDRFEDLTYGGYEAKAPPTDHLQEPVHHTRDGKRCEYYINGDGKSKPVLLTINKRYRSWNTFVSELEQKSKSACQYIFSIATGKRITKLEDFIHGERYVISGPSQKKLIPADYGSGNVKWTNRPMSTKVGNIRNTEMGLLSKYPPPPDAKPPGKYKKVKPPRLMTITNNTNRGIKAKVVINPNTSQLFEDVLSEMGSMVDVSPVNSLYTSKMPFVRVGSIKIALPLL